MNWKPLDGERVVGTLGSEGGLIVRDEEHPLGARITLERDCASAPWTITCGMYGWFFHTRFLGDESDAVNDYHLMQAGLENLLALVPNENVPKADEKMAGVGKAIERFVEQFP